MLRWLRTLVRIRDQQLFQLTNNHFIVVLEPLGEETMVNREEDDNEDDSEDSAGKAETGSPTFTEWNINKVLKIFQFLDKRQENIAICLSKADTHDKRGSRCRCWLN